MVLDNFAPVGKPVERIYMGSLKGDQFDELIANMENASGRKFSEVEKYKLQTNAKENFVGFITQASQVLAGNKPVNKVAKATDKAEAKAEATATTE